ncbi:SDR family oxidoreductase [Ancylothrix sp. C2]|uniref:dTDP-4-dehydrorhamnose reductase family protein n=1 Tax=Ancylothrix sp. D3o TaxID=2953691 RepID=UPI0021BB9D56|nr:SDR family oxidoreductase [Ancylothrix sp. D3o]MCT7950028.1 SDR family oxidoreductase [Ancylothrix sp. D3o]
MTKNSQIRVLILGGDGMLGHQLWKHFSRQPDRFDTRVTLRRDFQDYQNYQLFDPKCSYTGLDVRNFERIVEVFADFQPNTVINAVGIVKQRPTAKDSIISIEINALLPHRLALLCQAAGARLIHPSTDCVFSGKKGNYTEQDAPDPIDLYGRSKLMGEVNQPQALTLRTSIVGLELERKTGLMEWFLNAPSPVKGFQNAMYNGLTTIEVSRLIERLITEFPQLHGLYQVASEPISKYDLLCLLKEKFGLATEIIPDTALKIDRTLDSSRFRKVTSYISPSWSSMIEVMAEEAKEGRKYGS